MAAKKTSLQKKVIVIGLILITFQVGFLLYHHNKEQPLTTRTAIDKSIGKHTDLSQQRREQARIQLAIADFMGKNNGKPPESLQKLVPEYFPSVPIDPEKGTAFAYRIENGKPIVGDVTSTKPSGKTSKDKGAGKAEEELSTEDQKILIASLTDDRNERGPAYDPTGKRDPFRPFDFAPKTSEMTGATPLERYEIGQLRLTAVLSGGDDPKALVENSAGRGFTVTKGTKIGTRNGEVVDILSDRILILEKSVDFTGESKTNTVEMKLRTKDQSATQ